MVMIKTLAMKESRAWFGRLWMVEKILFLNVSRYKSYFTSASPCQAKFLTPRHVRMRRL